MKKILALTIIATFLNACVVEVERGGCIDSYADNYDASADYSNGNCDYSADIVFFYDAITAIELNGFTDVICGPIDRLDYYIDNVLVGSEYPLPAFIYAGIPSCFTPTYVTGTILWENSNTTAVSCRVEGVHEALLGDCITSVDEFVFGVEGKECASAQIRFLTKKKE